RLNPASLPRPGAAPDCSLVRSHALGSEGDVLPVLVWLHARGGEAPASLEQARALAGPGPDVFALQAARPCNPMQSNLRAAPTYAGFSWYLGDDHQRPEAASFADAIGEVESFVLALERPFVLGGDGQGAVLATTLALYAPPRLLGV